MQQVYLYVESSRNSKAYTGSSFIVSVKQMFGDHAAKFLAQKYHVAHQLAHEQAIRKKRALSEIEIHTSEAQPAKCPAHTRQKSHGTLTTLTNGR